MLYILYIMVMFLCAGCVVENNYLEGTQSINVDVVSNYSNNIGNLINGGSIVHIAGDVFVLAQDDGLYEYDQSTKVQTRLCDKPGYNLICVDEKTILFIDSEHQLNTFDLGENSIERISNEKMDMCMLHKSKIYFIEYTDGMINYHGGFFGYGGGVFGHHGRLGAIDLKTKEIEYLTKTEIGLFNIADDYLYYMIDEDGRSRIFKIDLINMQQDEVILPEDFVMQTPKNITKFYVCNGKLYFTIDIVANELYELDVEKQEIRTVVTDSFSSPYMNCSNGVIYYLDGMASLKTYDLQTGETTTVKQYITDVGKGIYVFDDSVFYISNTDNKVVYCN